MVDASIAIFSGLVGVEAIKYGQAQVSDKFA
jgi:hypothetical protein